MTVLQPIDRVTIDNGIAIASVCASLGYECVLIAVEELVEARQASFQIITPIL